MELVNKKVLIYGLGISGISTLEILIEKDLNLELIAVDNRKYEDLSQLVEKYKGQVDFYLEGDRPDLKDIDILVKSPGIAPHNELIKESLDLGISVITDFELAYILRKTDRIITITGTNGKTTSTSLVANLMKNANKDVRVAGNIGYGILKEMESSKEDTYFVVEASSFQLENTIDFKPRVSAIVNIKADHLDWHGNFQNYINSKMKLLKNQSSSDYAILNYDDENIRGNMSNDQVNIIYFSQKNLLENGIFLRDEAIFYKSTNEEVLVINLDEMNIITENAMVVIAIGIALGIDLDIIRLTLKEFKNLAHRIEYIDTINNVKYFNDSKGTNPDSTIKGIESMTSKIVLIAGGYDKGSDYSQMLETFKEKNRGLILMGQTKYNIENEAKKLGLENIYLVEDMKEAMDKAYEIAKDGDNVLLSPACASWGQYSNFEERGIDFIENVKRIGNDLNEEEKTKIN